MSGPPRRPGWAGIRFRLLALNALLVFLPAAGILFLDTYERQLLEDQERAMVAQGRVLAAALSGRGALAADDVRHTLVQLDQQTGARIRVVDAAGTVLADSSLLGPRRAPDREPAEPDAPVELRGLYRLGALPFRVWRRLFVPPEPPLESAEVYRAGEPMLGPEVRAALHGRYGALTRLSGGQRSITLYSALPVRHAGGVVGAVVISQSTYRILRALYEVRLGIFRIFLTSLAAAFAISLLFSRTIATPLERLRAQAEAALDRRGRLRGRFDLGVRRDEIGDLARSLEALRGRLERHLGDAEAFAADVSHELKNPLASIRAAGEMLAEVEKAEDRERFVEQIQREVARMEQLLSAVHELGRLDANSRPGSREPVDLCALLGGVVEAQRLRAGGAFVLRAPAEPVPVPGDAEQLARVFENVVGNAAGFARPGTTVEVEVEPAAGGTAAVRVLDRGPGIPPAHLERLFDRFFSYRPDDSTGGAAPPGAHVGLGLAIARSIVERHGGRLEASNRDGGGACFTVRLPVANGAS